MSEPLQPQEKEIRDSIEFYRGQGYAEAQIMTILRNKGYNEEFIDQMLSKPHSKFEATAIKPGGRALDLQSMFVAFLLFIVCAIAIIVIGSTVFGGPVSEAYMRQFTGYVTNFGVRPEMP